MYIVGDTANIVLYVFAVLHTRIVCKLLIWRANMKLSNDHRYRNARYRGSHNYRKHISNQLEIINVAICAWLQLYVPWTD